MARGRQRVYTDIRGWESGRLVVLDEVDTSRRAASTIIGERAPERRIRCACACGREKIVRLNDFMQGKSKSCGCGKGPKRLESEIGGSRKNTAKPHRKQDHYQKR
jgi:hypothetical protein